METSEDDSIHYVVFIESRFRYGQARLINEV